MRFIIPFLSALVIAGAAYAQPSGSTYGGGTTALSPNNCGTPDEPKACPGAKGAPRHSTAHRSPSKTQ